MTTSSLYFFFFFFNDTATTEIYPLSLHDALPICQHRILTIDLKASWYPPRSPPAPCRRAPGSPLPPSRAAWPRDRKSTRLNSSHLVISYAVFCLKKKKTVRADRSMSHTI